MRNAFSVFVFGAYHRFIPYYIFSIEKTYPGNDIVIFYNSLLPPNVKEYVDKKAFVVVYENFYKDFHFFKDYKMFGGGGLTLLRFLIPGKYFEGYKYVYFGDVDIVLLNERESLFQFHTHQLNETNLPFSNKVRPLPEGGLSKRLTGLHFVETEPYFRKMDAVIHRILYDETYRTELISLVKRDEEFLYLINKDAFQFKPCVLEKNITPLHGIHLGNFRDSELPNIEIDGYRIYREIYREQLKAMIKDQELLGILRYSFSKEMVRAFRFFAVRIPIQITIRYLIYQSKLRLTLRIKNLLKR